MRQILATDSALARNLEGLGPGNADVAEKLAAVEPRGDVAFTDTPQDVPAVTAGGVPLCSRHRPLDEARRLTDRIDLVEHAVVVVLGFGAGYHVQCLAERLDKAGILVVFEPDARLLRAVLERIDHSSWLRGAQVLFVTDPDDRGSLAAKLHGAESIIAQGVTVVEHPPSRRRLGDRARRFSALVSEHIAAAKVTFTTTLMRSADTVRNLLLNIDHYAAGTGIADLENAAAGHPAVVVSAGPSLQRNIHELAAPGVRGRCVIVAAQTTLRPLLAAGVRPHFITALDYHEISQRFYEDLTAESVGDATLIAEPKAHPVILDAFPGPTRCCASEFLDRVLGDLRRPVGSIPAGATVAHLAVYVARYLGCNPIVLIGQDLAFTDGLYYAAGTAIDEVWAPELNPFNTVEMMQWQRIARHRRHLSRARDINGRPVLTDAQMLTYLNQFERDFARYESEGVRVIDATEGGLPKQHTTRMPLADALNRHAVRPLPRLALPDPQLDPQRLEAVRARVSELRREADDLERTSRETAVLLQRMLQDQADGAKMHGHFTKLDGLREQVERRFGTFEIVNHLNQLGVYKRFRADRRLQMQRDLDPAARQRAQIDRDLENVTWTADATRELSHLLGKSLRVLAGEAVDGRSHTAVDLVEDESIRAAARAARVAALIPVDPDRNGLGVRRSLTAPLGGRPLLQATLERLGASSKLESIILIAPRDFDIEAVIDRDRIHLPVEVERCEGSPFGPEHAAIAAARRWSETCWRGGVAGMSVYDEVLCPTLMNAVMHRRGLTAALLVGPDWPLVDVSAESGCDAVIARHLDLPQQHTLVFTQAPPGLGGCLVAASVMQELALRNRLSTIGGLLVYQPHLPQHDPIARSANVQIDHTVRRSLIRATFDAPRYAVRVLAAMNELAGRGEWTTPDIVAALEDHCARSPDRLPKHLLVELCTERRSRGVLAGDGKRPPLSPALAGRLFEQAAESGDAVVTFAGAGDPMSHPEFDRLARLALEAGITGVHLRTELLAERPELDRLLACGVDVVSIDVMADRPETYRGLMGIDAFSRVVANLEYLVNNRTRLSDHPPAAALALPWIVPRMQRRAETDEEIDGFFDRWQGALGVALIDPPTTPGDTLLPTETPKRVTRDADGHTMTVLSDGSVPESNDDLEGPIAGTLADIPLEELWHRCLERQKAGAS